MQRDRSDAADRQHDSFLAPSLPKKKLWRFIIFLFRSKTDEYLHQRYQKIQILGV